MNRAVKCDCVAPTDAEGAGREYADPNCEACNGTGWVGLTESELEEWSYDRSQR